MIAIVYMVLGKHLMKFFVDCKLKKTILISKKRKKKKERDMLIRTGWTD